jgi:hypothetical protein
MRHPNFGLKPKAGQRRSFSELPFNLLSADRDTLHRSLYRALLLPVFFASYLTS